MKWNVLAVLCLAACNTTTGTDGGTPSSDGGTTDYAPPYVANWAVSDDVNADGADMTEDITIPIQRQSTNVIQLQGFCSDTDLYSTGPVADVTATGYTVRADSCSFADSSCTAGNLEFEWAAGSGSLSNNVLTGTLSGTVTCGEESVDYTMTFTSTSMSTYGSSTAHGGTGLARAIRLRAR